MKPWKKLSIIGIIIGVINFLFLILYHANRGTSKQPSMFLIIFSVLFYTIFFSIIGLKLKRVEINKLKFLKKGFVIGIIYGIISVLLYTFSLGKSQLLNNLAEIISPVMIFIMIFIMIFAMFLIESSNMIVFWPFFIFMSILGILIYGIIGALIGFILNIILKKQVVKPINKTLEKSNITKMPIKKILIIFFSVVIILLIIWFVIMFSIGGLGIHESNSNLEFKIEKGYAEYTEEKWFGTYQKPFVSGLLGGSSKTNKWFVISTNTKTRDCQIKYNKNILDNGFDDPYVISCESIDNLNYQTSIGRFKKDELLKYDYDLPDEKNTIIKL